MMLAPDVNNNTTVYNFCIPLGSKQCKTVTIKAIAALMVKYVKYIHLF